jgi:cellobiose-specific phosphotransferase system component IIC
MDAEVSTHTFLTMIIEEYVRFMLCEPIFLCAIILMWYTQNLFVFYFINWTLRMSDNLPERVQILCHAHIICITVLENRIICCQIFCDLLLKSAFEWIFNVMQLNLVKIKWHNKWKYLIQKFHNICLSYYFKYTGEKVTSNYVHLKYYWNFLNNKTNVQIHLGTE